MNIGKRSLILITAALLAACSSAPIVTRVEPPDREAEATAALAAGDYSRARSLYTNLAEQAAGNTQLRYRLGLARAELGLGETTTALATLDAVAGPLPPNLDAERASVRAEALFALGQTVAAIQLLIEREIWLDSAEAVADNQAQIWAGLSQPLSATARQQRTGDDIIDGWLALIPLTRIDENDPEFLAGVGNWLSDFPGHPAASGILAELVAATRQTGVRPVRIAVLLPLTSERRIEAEAILEGFFAAHFASPQSNGVSIQVYDTGQRGSVESFLTAQLSGADFIVGPLLPNEVDDVRSAQMQGGFVPTLALNLPETEAASSPNFYQFALSSDDEVDAIAARAIAAGQQTAVVLFANNLRGYRMMESFRDAFESRGGRIINSVGYEPESRDLSGAVKDVLNVSASDSRLQRLAANLGRTVEYEPRRRADIDMIFIQADPRIGRLLLPLLRNNGAEPDDIPTYSTSQVYDPSRANAGDDLNGLLFPDLPLLVDPAGQAANAARALNEFRTDSAEQQPRLFAFGFDAYGLVSSLATNQNAGWPQSGATGNLYLGDGGRIRRILPFAQFEAGQPQQAEQVNGASNLRR